MLRADATAIVRNRIILAHISRAMPRRKLRVAEVVQRFSLSNVQLFVCTLAESQATAISKGLAFLGLYGGMGVYGESAALAVGLSRDDAIRLTQFVRQVLAKQLPAAFRTSGEGMRRLRWDVNRFTAKWHGGGVFNGFVSLSYWPRWLDLSRTAVTITAADLESLDACIRTFYELDGERGIMATPLRGGQIKN